MYLAVVHSYIWRQGNAYQGAPESKRVAGYNDALVGYDAAVFGDNHSGFSATANHGNCDIMNTGGFIRRKIDETEYRPGVGILLNDGTIERVYLDISEDKMATETDIKNIKILERIDMPHLLEELNKLSSSSTSFPEAVRRWLEENRCRPYARQLLMEALGI